MGNSSVLISGAGVAGPALAYWLGRYGFDVTVVERAPAPRPGGQAIDIRGKAREVVEKMGIMDAVRARHTGTHGIAFLDAKGRPAARMGGGDLGDSGGLVAEIEILRGDLVRILLDAAGPDVEFLYDDHVTDLTEGADGVKATFASSPTRSFDLVVGADGLRSAVRTLAFGADAPPVTDAGYYQAYFPARSPRDFGGWEYAYNLPAGNGVGGRVVMIYPIAGTDQVRVLLAFASPELSYDRKDTETQKELLTTIFADAGWEIPDLISQVWAADDLYFARAGEAKPERWSAGRAVLLGDAAFSGSIGMGTSMALVGAYVLAGELAAARGDHRSAFAAYQNEMWDYVTANQQGLPGGLKGFLPPTRRAIWMRNQLMRLITRLPGAAAMTGDLQKKANLITLKDYQT